MPAAAPPLGTSLQARARDLLLLESAERTVQAFTPQQHAEIRKRYDAALRRASVASDLSDDRNVAVAFVLYREAVGLLVAAVIASRSPSAELEDPLSPRAIEALGPMAAAGKIPALPPEMHAAQAILLPAEPLAFDRMSPEELLSKRPAVEATIEWLRELVEPRSLAEIRATRAMRLVGFVTLVLVLLGWLIVRVTRPVNIALGKPVTVSEPHPASTAPVDNSGLTNGDIEASYGIHTNTATQGTAWVTIDLQAPVKISKVKVFNRADGWFDDGLPLSLEFSEDGTNFREVDRRAETFSSRAPWVFAAKGATTRYVRVKSPKYVALTEIEITSGN